MGLRLFRIWTNPIPCGRFFKTNHLISRIVIYPLVNKKANWKPWPIFSMCFGDGGFTQRTPTNQTLDHFHVNYAASPRYCFFMSIHNRSCKKKICGKLQHQESFGIIKYRQIHEMTIGTQAVPTNAGNLLSQQKKYNIIDIIYNYILN